jgi:hypothetical protein
MESLIERLASVGMLMKAQPMISNDMNEQKTGIGSTEPT